MSHSMERLAFSEGWSAANEVVHQVVLELDAAGQGELADQVFDLVWERLTVEQRDAARMGWIDRVEAAVVAHMHDQLRVG